MPGSQIPKFNASQMAPERSPINMGIGVNEDHAEDPGPNLSQGKGHRECFGNPQLREFVTQTVEEKLSTSAQRRGKPWLECAGELVHLHNETKRIQKLIDEEFEQIEPEDLT